MPTLPDTPLSARQGDTYKLTVTWKDASGTAVNLTGADAEFGIATSPGSSQKFQYSTADYLTITAATGQVAVEIPHTETRKWSEKRYFYELTITKSDGTRTTILEGNIKVTPEVVV